MMNEKNKRLFSDVFMNEYVMRRHSNFSLPDLGNDL